MKKRGNFSRAVEELMNGRLATVGDDDGAEGDADGYRAGSAGDGSMEDAVAGVVDAAGAAAAGLPGSPEWQPGAGQVARSGQAGSGPLQQSGQPGAVQIQQQRQWVSEAGLPVRYAAPDPRDRPPPEPARITRDMVIKGSVSATTDILIAGSISGDVVSEGTLSITGEIEGNLSGRSVNLAGARIFGNIRSESIVTVGPGSSVRGDITAVRIDVDGALEGNITASDSVALRPNALVAGNISGSSLSMSEGAQWKGQVAILKAEDAGQRPGQ